MYVNSETIYEYKLFQKLFSKLKLSNKTQSWRKCLCRKVPQMSFQSNGNATLNVWYSYRPKKLLSYFNCTECFQYSFSLCVHTFLLCWNFLLWNVCAEFTYALKQVCAGKLSMYIQGIITHYVAKALLQDESAFLLTTPGCTLCCTHTGHPEQIPDHDNKQGYVFFFQFYPGCPILRLK